MNRRSIFVSTGVKEEDLKKEGSKVRPISSSSGSSTGKSDPEEEKLLAQMEETKTGRGKSRGVELEVFKKDSPSSKGEIIEVRKYISELDRQYIEKGIKIIEEILELTKEREISDIQIHTERFIYINTKEGNIPLPIYGRLTKKLTKGILIGLHHNRRGQGQIREELLEKECEILLTQLANKRKVDFACEGGRYDNTLQHGRMR